MLEAALIAMQSGADALATMTAQAEEGGDTSQQSDAMWLRLPRDKKLVDTLLSMPPGLPVSQIHRCVDLNPDDCYLHEGIRQSIEASFQPYVETLLEIKKRRSQALASVLTNSSAPRVPIAPAAPGDPLGTVSILLHPTDQVKDEGITQIEQVEEHLVSRDIEPELMREYDYLTALYWYCVREMGCQVVGTYGALGLLPSLALEQSITRIWSICSVRAHI